MNHDYNKKNAPPKRSSLHIMHQKLPSSTTSTTPQKTKVKMNLMVFSMDRISIWVLYFEAPPPPFFHVFCQSQMTLPILLRQPAVLCSVVVVMQLQPDMQRHSISIAAASIAVIVRWVIEFQSRAYKIS